MEGGAEAFYNENDAYPAAWLRNLMTSGHLPKGTVDERSIADLAPEDCAPVSHFFAGIGGWPYALRLAGWPDDRPVWTGSCPCQPFSVAGKRGGTDDPRHLWPEWFRLIRECRPPVVFGEQVASRDGLAWLDLVQSDLEGEGYSVGALDLCAASFGAPHIRQRLYFVAESGIRAEQRVASDRDNGSGGTWRRGAGSEDGGELGDAEGGEGRPGHDLRQGQSNSGSAGVMVNVAGEQARDAGQSRERAATNGFWADAEWLPCTDGKARPVEPGTFPLAHGVPARVGRLRAYGNAIVPPQAAAFVKAYMERENP